MKQVQTMIAALLTMLALSATAQKTDFNVKSGDSKILPQKTTACVEFDYSNTMIGDATRQNTKNPVSFTNITGILVSCKKHNN